ncbi:hypothetical protein GSI_12337 [Ganoderma sinense ZZ0214-1]|uniref:Uncharacterized protein n=1 Tax=Ganoderma sinense ZZ0214-1 TaxID=1077348 RepID=A0A2G8RYH7_9APHY|nr:hypothetical protein GSI_12337 [Ganoderma sinense ZZ0214-1]
MDPEGLGDLTKRLPEESLARIFLAWKASSWWSKAHGLGAEWVRAAWVCKRWRDVALKTPTLWSLVLLAGGPGGIQALEVQLDRARGTPLDLLVLSREMSVQSVKAALGLVLRNKKRVKYLKVVFDIKQGAIVEAFVKGVRTKLVSLSLRSNADPAPDDGLEFTPANFRCLTKLDLKAIIPVQVQGAPMLKLTKLTLKYPVEYNTPEPEEPWRRVHSFLEACPNLKTLKVTFDFGLPVDPGRPQLPYDDLRAVTLPKLRHLALNSSALDMSTVLGTLRLPALSSVELTAYCGSNPEDCDFFVIPQNISGVLPPLRRATCVTLTVDEDLCLSGDSEDSWWSVTLPDLEWTTERYRGSPCCLWYNAARFLARIPLLVDPAVLVDLELHLANGLPIARDWARFFGGMVRLRSLEIGGVMLIRNVLEAFELAADSGLGLCPELEDVALCFGNAKNLDGADAGGAPLSEFVPRTIEAWVRGRARSLETLTILTRDGAGADDSDSSSAEDEDSVLPCDEGSAGGAQTTMSRLWRVLEHTLQPGGSVDEVVWMDKYCGACDRVYESVDADEIGDEELEEGTSYY